MIRYLISIEKGTILRRNITLEKDMTISGFTALVLYQNRTRKLLIDLKHLYLSEQECDLAPPEDSIGSMA